MFALEFWILLALLGYVLYKWSTSTFDTFEKRGIPFDKPYPLIGNSGRFLKKECLHKIMLDIYKNNKQHKIFGFYNFRNPFFLVNDPDLIKKMAVKDFDSFANHQKLFSGDTDPLLNGMLTMMKGQRWKDMRNTITPAFTGAKMRGMFTLMNDCFEETMNYLRKASEGRSSFEIELKDCFYRLSNDLIATTAFGLQINSFKDKQNDFYSVGTSLTRTRGIQAIKFMLFSFAPKLCQWLGINPLDPKIAGYFVRLVANAMKYREENNIVRPDMIQLLLEAKKEAPNKWSQEDLVAQCFIFFFAAFENNATLLCTACMELMDNPDVQEKLYEEICESQKKLEGKSLDYEAVKGLKYMDMVLSETLRKWSIGALIDRECGTDYRVTDDDGNFICDLKQGDTIWFHAIGLHWDEQYFEDPAKFKPERFDEENKDHIKPFTYFPFGVGPRSCIGNRYALMQAKVMLFNLFKEFRIERCEKSIKSLYDESTGFALGPKHGYWFKLIKRE